MKLKVFILKRVNNFDSPTGSFLSLVSRFLTKNQVYTNFEEVHLLALLRNEFDQLESLIKKVSANSNLYCKMDFKDTVCQKILQIRDNLQREEGQKGQFHETSLPEFKAEAARKQGRGKKMAKILFKKLIEDKELNNMLQTSENSFNKNWFKLKTGHNQYIILKDIVSPPLTRYKPVSYTHLTLPTICSV